MIGHRVFVEAFGCQSTTFSLKFVKKIYKFYFFNSTKTQNYSFLDKNWTKFEFLRMETAKINISL